MVGLFVRRSLGGAHPLLDLTILRLRPYRNAIVLAVLFQAAFTADLLLLPSYFQQVRGLGATAAGLFIVLQGPASESGTGRSAAPDSGRPPLSGLALRQRR